ncbi:hypothetical protein EDD17DRAFT_1787474 [Pisolithus thermaeus]|nr:hypothetical protein EDD17DRAFT_1787474 [Pisolithus thermaeus]
MYLVSMVDAPAAACTATQLTSPAQSVEPYYGRVFSTNLKLNSEEPSASALTTLEDHTKGLLRRIVGLKVKERMNWVRTTPLATLDVTWIAMGKKSGYHSPGMLVVLPKGCMPGTPKSNIQPTQPTHGSDTSPDPPLSQYLVAGLEKQIHHIYNPRPTTQVELEMHHDHDYSDSTCRSAKRHESFSPEQEHSMINGANLGKHFCLNVPLQDGIDDETYLTVFETVIEATVAAFRPTAIVLQRSAASLGCDRLGAFNFSIAAHGKCVNFVRRFNVPLRAPSRGAGRTRLLFSLAQKYRTNCPPVYDPFLRHSQWKFHPLLTESPPDLEGLLANEDQNREERDEERGTGRAAATGVPPSMSTSKVIRRRPRPLSGPKRNSISPSVRKPRSKRTRGRGRGRASRTHGREDGKEVDEPGGPSSAKPGKTRGRTRSHVKPRCRVAEKVKDMGDVDADVGGEPESGFEPATPVDIGIDM